MNSIDEAELDAILLAGDSERCLEFFVQMEPAKRRGFARCTQARFNEFQKGEFKEFEAGSSRWVSSYTDDQRRAAHVAYLATCTASELAKIATHYALKDTTVALERLRPTYLEEAAEIVTAASVENFSFAHDLVIRGLSRRPRHQNYPLGLVSRWFTVWSRRDNPSLATILLTTPSLLEHEVWALLDVEGGGEYSLSAYDKYCHGRQTWAEALLELMRGGHLSRARLIEATLAALSRDYAPFRAGWFSRFLALLELDGDELSAHRERFVALLASSVPATVTAALDAVETLEKVAPAPADELASALTPVTLARHKSTAKRALGLLRAIAAREPSATSEVARAAALALGHEATDVQKAALDLLDLVGDVADAELASRVLAAAPAVSATLQKRLTAWGAGAAAPYIPADPVMGAVGFDPAPFNVLDPARAITPLRSLEELIYAQAQVLEDDSDPIEIERVLAAIARYGADRPADFEERVSPLVKRASKLSGRYAERPLTHTLACLTTAWTAPRGHALKSFLAHADAEALRNPTLIGFGTLFYERALEIARGLDAAPGRETLSMPTHQGGFIDPLVLVDRLARTPAPSALDFVIALLRLPKVDHRPALERAKEIVGPAGDALRHALGGPLTGDPASPWSHAAAARPRRASWRWVTRKSGEYTFCDMFVTAEPAPPPVKRVDRPADLIYQSTPLGKTAGWTRSLISWAVTVWPTGHEGYLFDALPRLDNNIDWWQAQWENVAYYQLLREPSTEVGPLGRLALAIGLGSKEAGESGVATDAAIAALEQGRVDGQRLGEGMEALRGAGKLKLKRCSKTLGVVARSSRAHALEVIVAIERTLRGDPKAAPRDEGAWVSLLCELLAETGSRVGDAEAWSYLAQSRHAKKVAAFRPAP